MAENWQDTQAGFKRYLLTRGRSRDTAETYSAHLRPLWTWATRRELHPALLSYDLVEAWLADELAEGHARSTVHVRLSAVKAYYGWLIERGLRTDEPASALTVRKDRRQPRPPLSEAEVMALLAAARGPEERLLILVGVRCGLRISEIISLRGQDLFTERGLLLVKGKGHKERWLSPPADLLAELGALAGSRKGRIFDLTREQARRILNRIARHAGVSAFYPHRMRITFASRLLGATHDLHSLQILMGHSDPGVTAHYAAFDAQRRALETMRRMQW